MADFHDHHANARNLAIDILRREKIRTPEKIYDTAVKAAQAQTIFDPEANVRVDQLAAELRHLFSVSAEAGTVLEDPAEHRPWYPTRRSTIHWRFWNRYTTYLE